VVVYLDGDVYRETVNVVDELPSGVSRAAALLPWDDGAMAFEFAGHELNDTSRPAFGVCLKSTCCIPSRSC